MENYDLEKTNFIKNHSDRFFMRGKILDIGCNECSVAEKLLLNKKNYLGLDIDDMALEIAKGKGFRIKKIDLSKNTLPFKDNSFENFLCLDLLEHLIDPLRMISEIKRVVASGGRGIISLPNDLNLTNILKVLFLGRSIATRDTIWSPRGHLHLAGLNSSINLIRNNFRVLKIFYLANSYTVPFSPRAVRSLFVKISPRLFSQNIIFLVEN